MAFSLRPQSPIFYELFEKAANNLVTGTGLLTESISCNDTKAVSAKLVELEHSSDEITHSIYQHLNSTFITPFDREDIYNLASQLDDVMDHVEAIGSLFYLYGICDIDDIPCELYSLVSILNRQASTVDSSLPKLRKMEDLNGFFVECNRLENEGDQLYRMMLVKLFSGRYRAIEVMKLKELADELEEACDAFEHVANIMETIVVKV